MGLDSLDLDKPVTDLPDPDLDLEGVGRLKNIKAIMEVVSPEEGEVESLEDYGRDADWFDANHSELRKQFGPNRVVAVRDGQVVADADDLESLMERVEEKRYDGSKVFVSGFQPAGVGYIL